MLLKYFVKHYTKVLWWEMLLNYFGNKCTKYRGNLPNKFGTTST